jgi:hypothetical protein
MIDHEAFQQGNVGQNEPNCYGRCCKILKLFELAELKPNLDTLAMQLLMEFGDVGEGEIVVFQPVGNGESKLVARVAPEAWAKWAKST